MQVTITQLEYEQLLAIKQEYELLEKQTNTVILQSQFNEIRADLKLTKETIMHLLKMLGLVDENNVFKETVNYSKLIGSVMGLATGGKNKANKFEFLLALKPILEKYQSL